MLQTTIVQCLIGFRYFNVYELHLKLIKSEYLAEGIETKNEYSKIQQIDNMKFWQNIYIKILVVLPKIIFLLINSTLDL